VLAARLDREPRIVDAWWFRLLARATLAMLALVMVVSGSKGWEAFFDRVVKGDFDTAAWLAWVPRMIAAGFLFGLAAWLPFRRLRYRWSRLLLAGLALAPLAQYWWLFLFQLQRNNAVGGWLYRLDWLLAGADQKVLAVLAGVAVASVFTAAPEEAVSELLPVEGA
jgi:ABC-type sulfate transport system permease subunit